MSSTQITNLDLSEPQEVLDTEVKSKESNDTSTLNSEDQEVQNNLIEEKQKDKDLESETIVEERKQFEEVVVEKQKDTDNDSAKSELNQEEQDKEKSVVTDVNTNETEQISEENKDQSGWSAVWDDNAQAYYYWNMVTNETTWVNPNLTAQTVNSEYSEQDYYYYSQYGYYPEAYYYGYDNSALTDMTTTAVTTTEPPTNPLDSLLDKIDKEVKSKLDKNSSKTKSSSTSDSQYNDQQYQQEQEQQEPQELQELQEQQEQQEQTSLTTSSTDLDPYYDQNQMATNDADYQSFLAQHGGDSEYKLTARFNAKTGKFQRDPTLNPEKFSADSKAIRQMSYFFDYDQFAETRGAASNKRLSSEASLGDSIRSPKKLNKKDIEMFKQKKKEKKDMKKKSWLLSEND